MKRIVDGVVLENRRRLLVTTDEGIFILDDTRPSYPQRVSDKVKVVIETDENDYYISVKLAGS